MISRSSHQRKHLLFFAPLSIVVAMGFSACFEDSVVEPPAMTGASADTAFDVFANISGTAVNNAADVFAGAATRTFYSLRTNSVVTDTSAGWDLGFSGTGILVNGASQLVATTFDSVKTVPDAGYVTGSVPSWYNYAGAPTHLITPKADTTIALRLADGKYAKLAIRNYYKGAPANPNGLTDTTKYYTFRYVLQSNGTRDVSPNSPYTYFSLETGAVVTDTAAGWDLGLRTTGIITRNGGQLLTGTFDALTTAPEAGYLGGALPAWYTYSSETHVVTPTLGKVIVLKTSGGQYAKVEILSYYQGNPAVPNSESVSRYYTFRWFRQADGSRNLQ